MHQRAADSGALLHPTGEFARILSLEAGKADQREKIARTRAHGSSVGAWKTIPVSSRGSVTFVPPIDTVPPVGATKPATRRSNVDLPQPDGPTRQTNSFRRTSSETSDMATTCSPPRVTKVFAT